MMRIGGAWCTAYCGAPAGVLARRITRTWIGLVWVRSSLRSPFASGFRKKVSCISRAGWRGGKLSAEKLWKSSSMSGPSATLKPISANTATISSITCSVGCTEPLRRGGDGGRDRIAQPVDRRAFDAALVRAHRAQALEQAGYHPGLAERGDADLIQ